jgi:hypothetical protein
MTAPELLQRSPPKVAVQPPGSCSQAPQMLQRSPQEVAMRVYSAFNISRLSAPESYRIHRILESAPALRLGGHQNLVMNITIACEAARLDQYQALLPRR